MRVLFVTVTYGLNGETDGCATLLKGLVKELNILGVETGVLTYGPATQRYEDPVSKGNTIFSHKPLLPIKVDKMPYYTDPLFSISSTYKSLMNEKFDVVISSTPEFLGKFAQQYCKKNNAKFVSYHITNIRGQFETRAASLFGAFIGKKIGDLAQRIYLKYLASANVVLVMSLATARDLKNLGDIKSVIISPGIDVNYFVPSANKKRTNGAIFVGRLEAEKNLEELVYAFKDSDVPLTIVGPGSMLETLKVELPKAIFTGKLSHDELIPLYQTAGFFVFPSTNDTFGIAVLEALSCGLPCVIFNKGGQVEMIEHGVNGFIAKDSKEFAHYINVLTEDEELRKRMSVSARELAKRYSWVESGKKLFSVLKPQTPSFSTLD